MASGFANYLMFGLFLAKVNFLIEVSEVHGYMVHHRTLSFILLHCLHLLCIICTLRAAYFSEEEAGFA